MKAEKIWNCRTYAVWCHGEPLERLKSMDGMPPAAAKVMAREAFNSDGSPLREIRVVTDGREILRLVR